jgi:hypothetical protein
LDNKEMMGIIHRAMDKRERNKFEEKIAQRR